MQTIYEVSKVVCLKAVSTEFCCDWNWYFNSSGNKVTPKVLYWKTLPFNVLLFWRQKVVEAFQYIYFLKIPGQQALLRISQSSNIRQCNDHRPKLHLGLQQNLNHPPRRAPNRFKRVLPWQRYSWNKCVFFYFERL